MPRKVRSDMCGDEIGPGGGNRQQGHGPGHHAAPGPHGELRRPAEDQAHRWSRRIVGCRVEESESMDDNAELIQSICDELDIDAAGLVLHADNGGAMKGSTMLATLQRLGIVASFSRPKVSEDNPYSEALLRTLKYRPWYPGRPFESIEQARPWVASFVTWYNEEHLHSAIGFVTSQNRHAGRDAAIRARRRQVYAQARQKHSERWSGPTRSWDRVQVVRLNPDAETNHTDEAHATAARSHSRRLHS